MEIDARMVGFRELNEKIAQSTSQEITINGCLGQRYIGSAMSHKTLVINGTPGNALGCYLDGAHIVVNGNAQDATGDTMNEGSIVVHGSSGDATGYAMRGGKIMIRDNAGYRAGIHMKAYQDKNPILVIGGQAGSFLGEYQAGGIIIVLGLNVKHGLPVGYFCGTGMHGGTIYLRSDCFPDELPLQVLVEKADDLSEIEPLIKEYCELFDVEQKEVIKKDFYKLKPDTKNPYRQLYTNI